MIDIREYAEVKVLQSNMRTALDSEAGREVVKYLEQICGWYDFSETEPNQIMIAHGKRQVLATIKTLLTLSPDEIVAIAKKEI